MAELKQRLMPQAVGMTGAGVATATGAIQREGSQPTQAWTHPAPDMSKKSDFVGHPDYVDPRLGEPGGIAGRGLTREEMDARRRWEESLGSAKHAATLRRPTSLTRRRQHGAMPLTGGAAHNRG
jgi:hypothetical protein